MVLFVTLPIVALYIGYRMGRYSAPLEVIQPTTYDTWRPAGGSPAAIAAGMRQRDACSIPGVGVLHILSDMGENDTTEKVFRVGLSDAEGHVQAISPADNRVYLNHWAVECASDSDQEIRISEEQQNAWSSNNYYFGLPGLSLADILNISRHFDGDAYQYDSLWIYGSSTVHYVRYERYGESAGTLAVFRGPRTEWGTDNPAWQQCGSIAECSASPLLKTLRTDTVGDPQGELRFQYIDRDTVGVRVINPANESKSLLEFDLQI